MGPKALQAAAQDTLPMKPRDLAHPGNGASVVSETGTWH